MADWWPRVYSAYAWSRTAQGTGVLLYCGAYAALGLCLSSSRQCRLALVGLLTRCRAQLTQQCALLSSSR